MFWPISEIHLPNPKTYKKCSWMRNQKSDRSNNDTSVQSLIYHTYHLKWQRNVLKIILSYANNNKIYRWNHCLYFDHLAGNATAKQLMHLVPSTYLSVRISTIQRQKRHSLWIYTIKISTLLFWQAWGQIGDSWVSEASTTDHGQTPGDIVTEGEMRSVFMLDSLSHPDTRNLVHKYLLYVLNMYYAL